MPKIITNKKYYDMERDIETLRRDNQQLVDEIKKVKDTSIQAEAERFKSVLVAFGLNPNNTRFQAIAERAALSILGRDNEAIQAYSRTVFLKDNDEKIMQRALDMTRNESAITQDTGKNK